jgi:hypothetical protein
MKKIFFSGLIVGIIIATIGTAFAAIGIKDAYFNTDIKVNYNGIPVDIEKITVIKDGEVNGKTFGSIADTAVALGKTVSWDGPNNTININDTEVKSMSTIAEPTTIISINESEWIALIDFAKQNTDAYHSYFQPIQGQMKSTEEYTEYSVTTSGYTIKMVSYKNTNYINIQDLKLSGIID